LGDLAFAALGEKSSAILEKKMLVVIKLFKGTRMVYRKKSKHFLPKILKIYVYLSQKRPVFSSTSVNSAG